MTYSRQERTTADNSGFTAKRSEAGGVGGGGGGGGVHFRVRSKQLRGANNSKSHNNNHKHPRTTKTRNSHMHRSVLFNQPHTAAAMGTFITNKPNIIIAAIEKVRIMNLF